MPRLLVIEDQRKLLNSLQRGLEEEGYEVITAATGEQGYYAAVCRGASSSSGPTIWKWTCWRGAWCGEASSWT